MGTVLFYLENVVHVTDILRAWPGAGQKNGTM